MPPKKPTKKRDLTKSYTIKLRKHMDGKTSVVRQREGKWFYENREVVLRIKNSAAFKRGDSITKTADQLYKKTLGIGSRKTLTKRTRTRRRYYGANRAPKRN